MWLNLIFAVIASIYIMIILFLLNKKICFTEVSMVFFPFDDEKHSTTNERAVRL